MSYVLMHTETRELVRSGSNTKTYTTVRAAKAARTRLLKAGLITEEFKPITLEEFHKTDPMVTVKSLMSGADVQIPQSQVGSCCDPSTERYWSM